MRARVRAELRHLIHVAEAARWHYPGGHRVYVTVNWVVSKVVR